MVHEFNGGDLVNESGLELCYRAPDGTDDDAAQGGGAAGGGACVVSDAENAAFFATPEAVAGRAAVGARTEHVPVMLHCAARKLQVMPVARDDAADEDGDDDDNDDDARALLLSPLRVNSSATSAAYTTR